MLENGVVLFDIDKTIFDTKKSGEKVLQSIGLITRRTPEEIEKIDKDYKSGLISTTDFNPYGFLKIVSEQTGVEFEELNQVMSNPDNFVLYPETLETFEKLFKKGCKLGIFSEGKLGWQMEKLILTGLINYLTESLILIEKRKIAYDSIRKIPNRAEIVEDKIEVIRTLFKIRPDLAFNWINRENEKYVDSGRVKTIKSLIELV
jgi:phosphoglycolate phosphatase-like HAD superfamily hydrolase